MVGWKYILPQTRIRGLVSNLKNKKILLAVTGGIAAYKTAALVRLLVKNGAEVRVIISASALDFITPLTLSTLSKNPVLKDFKDENETWQNHVELGIWADLILVAPLTANTLSKMANGLCDNLIIATYLSAKCPTVVAPAMDLDMYIHPTTNKNLEIIKNHGVKVIAAAEGELASGLYGQGRMEEPENIVEYLEEFFSLEKKSLDRKNILITAGPTYENIDPVRFIGNHSSGKMGFALAEKAASFGANVTLITGPTLEKLQVTNIKRIDVFSAQEMMEAVKNNFDNQDAIIMSAAVSDYRPQEVANQKIKKKTNEFSINLVKNPDILQYLGTIKGNKYLVGFALETNNAIENAKGKLKRKNADLIVLNTLEDEEAGFGKNTNKVTFVTEKESPISFPLKSKHEVAKDILIFIADKINNNA